MLITKIDEDVDLILREHKLRNNGITQFYVSSTEKDFENLMERIAINANIDKEKWIKYALISGYHDGITDRLKKEEFYKDGGFLIFAYYFAGSNIIGHTLNQFITYKNSDIGKSILGIHIDIKHENYFSALSTAKDSQFKSRIIEIKN